MASDRGLIPRAGQEGSPEPSCGPGQGLLGWRAPLGTQHRCYTSLRAPFCGSAADSSHLSECHWQQTRGGAVSKGVGGGAPWEFPTGLSLGAGYREVGSRVERGGGVGGGVQRCCTPPTSWEHSRGVKEARELSANLGVKWEVLCRGKGCQGVTISGMDLNLGSNPGVPLHLKEPTDVVLAGMDHTLTGPKVNI